MEYIYEYFLEIVECKVARNGFTNWKTFFTNILKVPKREIFDHSDFPDFYTIKSLREGDFGVKI